MGAIQTLCPRSLLLRQGQMVDDGESESVISTYLSRMKKNRNEIFTLHNPDRTNSGAFRFTDACLLNSKKQETDQIIAGEDISIKFRYESDQNFPNLKIDFAIYDDKGQPLTYIDTSLKNKNILFSENYNVVECNICKNPFPVGNYYIALVAFSDAIKLDHLSFVFDFSVVDSIYFGTQKVPYSHMCSCYVDHEWEFSHENN